MKIWRPYTQMKNALPQLKVNDAKGAYINLKCGKKIFDGISSWWLITHGHTEDNIAKAISLQSQKLEQVVFANFGHEAADELVELLSTFLPKELSSVFFSDNGSTSVEVAMKMAYQYFSLKGQRKKTKFITFKKGYHGDTCGAMSLSSRSLFSYPYKKLLFDVIQVEQGTSINDPLQTWINHFEEILDRSSDQICAVVLEPLIQGAGGMIVWPIKAINTIVKMAKEKNILVIFDEVMTGFGRTGTMFAFEQVDFIPDFLCLSKGLTGGFFPMGLTITKDEIYDTFLNDGPRKMFYHGHSFTGNALSCAAAAANLKTFKSINLSEYTNPIKQAHIQSLNLLKNKKQIKEVRVCGTIGIIELKLNSVYGDQFSYKFQNLTLKENLFIRPLGNIIYLMPPYCSLPNEIETSWKIIENTIDELYLPISNQ